MSTSDDSNGEGVFSGGRQGIDTIRRRPISILMSFFCNGLVDCVLFSNTEIELDMVYVRKCTVQSSRTHKADSCSEADSA